MLEYANGGDLRKFINIGFKKISEGTPKEMTEDVARELFKEITEAVGFLHANNTAHRYLNILIYL